MSVSAIFGTRIAVVPTPAAVGGGTAVKLPAMTGGGSGGYGVIECSSRPQKKSTAHHMKTRPRKTQPWDIKRRPTVYAPLPPLPPDWTLVSSGTSSAEEATAAAPPPAPDSQ